MRLRRLPSPPSPKDSAKAWIGLLLLCGGQAMFGPRWFIVFLPLLVFWWMAPVVQQDAALRVPFYTLLAGMEVGSRRQGGGHPTQRVGAGDHLALRVVLAPPELAQRVFHQVASNLGECAQ